jgi:hypothetical protein
MMEKRSKNDFIWAWFRFQIFSLSPSHQIFGYMHGAVNIGKKITNYTVG